MALRIYKAGLSWPRKSRYLLISDHAIENWYGMNTVESDITKLPDGQTPDALNWYTGDDNECIILRRGTHLLGQTRNTGNGAITGLGIGTDVSGNQIPFFSYGQKLKYYDVTTNDTVEIGTNIIPAAASADSISISSYQNLAGYFVYIGSPNWDIIKIPVSNPGSYVSMSSVNYRGNLKFGQSRFMLWHNNPSGGVPDTTGLYMGHVDQTTLNNLGTNYTYTGTTATGSKTVTAMSAVTSLAAGMSVVGVGIAPSTIITATTSTTVTLNNPAVASGSGVSLTFTTLPFPFAYVTNEAVGNLGSKSYTYTLATVAGRNTCFQVIAQATVAAGTEVFTDLENGTLISNYGGTGTIDYAMGSLTLNFSAVTTGNVTANYYTEDSAVGGVCDFSIESGGSPAVRIPGSGRYFAQFDGGGFQTLQSMTNVFYCFHKKKTYQVTVQSSDDDTQASPSTNLPYREQMGTSGIQSTYSAPEGVYYVNNQNPSKPQVYYLEPYTSAAQTNTAIPKLISEALNLSGFAFQYCVVRKWGWYVLVCCQNIVNGVVQTFNSRTFLYNTRGGSWDQLDCPSSCLAEWNGQLLSGDPLTNNVWQLFTGFDDDNAIIQNYYTSGNTNQGVTGQKTTLRMVIQGLIQPSQNVKVEVSYDNGGWVEVFRVLGTGSYVNTMQPTSVGSYTLGAKEIGGVDTVIAFPFEVEFGLSSPRYQYIRFRLTACVGVSQSKEQPQSGGYVQINKVIYKAQRYKGTRDVSQAMVA